MSKITDALLEAQKALENVGRDKSNKHGNYDYVSAEEMIRSCREVLHEQGLSLFVLHQGLEVIHTKTLSRDGAKDVDAVHLHRVLRLSKGDEHIDLQNDWVTPIENGRPLDKAMAVATTSAMNYFLRDLLLVPRVDKSDDLDHDGSSPLDDALALARSKKLTRYDVEALAAQCQSGAKSPRDLKGKAVETFRLSVEQWKGHPFDGVDGAEG